MGTFIHYFVVWSVVISCASFLLVVCSITPRLLHVVCRNESQDFGVWYVTVCEEASCETMTYWHDDIDTKHFRRGSSQIFETQLTVTAALVLCIASLILESRVIQYNKRAGNHQHCPVLQGTVYIYYVLAVFLCGSATLVSIPFISLMRTNVSLHTIFSNHEHHSCNINLPYGLIVLALCEIFAVTAAIFACWFAFKASKKRHSDQCASSDGEGHQMVALVSKNESVNRGYTHPVKPGYTTSLTKDTDEST